MIYNSVYQPTNPSAGVLGTSMIDLTSTSFAQLFADADDYSSSTPYKKGDIVYNQNSLWVYVNVNSSSGNPPPTLPTLFNAYWEFIGSQGNFTWLAYADSPTGFVPLTGVQITGTAGQFSCTSTTLVVGDIVSITGNLGGTGNIVGFTNKSGYKISATNGSTTFTLVKPDGSAITTAIGSTVGLSLTRFTLTNFTTGDSGTRAYMGIASNKLSASESTYPADYFWKKVVGDTGSAPIYAGINKASISVPTDVDGTNQTYVASSDTRISVLEGNTTLEYDGVGTSPGTWALKVSGITVSTGGVSGTVISGTIVPGTLQADTQSYAIINAVSGMTTDTATIRYDISGKNASGIAFTTTVTQTFAKVKGGVIDIVAPNTPAGLALTTSTETLPGGNSIGRIKASWTANAETDLAHYQIEIKSAESDIGDVEWISTKVTGTNYEWVATPGSYYIVRVCAVDKSNNKSGYDYLGSVTADSLALSSVTIGSGGSFTCSSSALVVGQPIYVKGTLTGTGTIASYSNPKPYYIKTTNGTTTFTLSATPTGSAITTTAGTSTGLTFYKRLSYIKIAPDSAAPGLPSAVVLNATFRTIFIEWTNPTDADLAYINIWSSPTSTGTYTKIASVPVSPNEAVGNYSHTGLSSGETRFYKLESVDSSGNVSTKTAASGTTTLKLVSEDIDNGILDSAAMYATSIKPVEVIAGTSTPTTGNFEGRKVLLIGNGLQYVYTSGDWVPVTVDAGTITVGQLQAGRIAAGAIGADEIAANVISTSKMLVVGSNLIPNSDFSTGSFAGWKKQAGASAQSIVAITSGSYTGPAGSPSAYVAKFSYTGVADTISTFAAENVFGDPLASTDGIAVQEGEKYFGSIFAVKSATYASDSLRLRAYFYLTDGTYTTYDTFMSLSLTTSWAQYSGTFTVPANATRCWVQVSSVNMTAGIVYWTNLKVLRKNSSELIVDGAIKTNHMVSETISGDVISGDSLHADKIIAATLTADRIKIPATGGIDPGIQVGSTGVSLGTVNTRSAEGAAAASNFNANNDRNNTTPTAPTIPTAGAAIDHTINTDGSADISFEWLYTDSSVATAANNIDGFFIYIYSSTSSSAYTIGTTPALEQVMVVPSTTRAIVLPAVAANKYYTFGVQAYRAVDSDIDSSGVKKSAIIKSTVSGENPYRPSASVAFDGNITGTVDGTDVSTVVSNAALGAQDPAVRINTNTTLIDPGSIKIYGATKLSDWMNGPASTEINGGAIAADTITVNKVSVGMRGLITTGITFNAVRDPDTNIPTKEVTWTAGNLIHYTDSGTSLARSVNAGSATWSSGTLYMYWIKPPETVSSFSVAGTTVTLNYAQMSAAPYLAGEKIEVTDFTGTNSANANGVFTVVTCTSTALTYTAAGTVTGLGGTPVLRSEINSNTSRSIASRDNTVVLATYVSTASPTASTVTNLTVNVGKTIIDGTSISTGTVNAEVLAANSGIVRKLFLGSPTVPRFTLDGDAWGGGGGKGLLTISDSALTPIVRMGYLTSGSVGFELRNSSNEVLMNASTSVSSIDNGQTGINKCNVQYSEFNQSSLPPLDYTSSTAGYAVVLAGTGKTADIKGIRLTTASTGSAVCYAFLGATSSTYNIVLSPNTTYLVSSWVRNTVASTSGVLRVRLDDVGTDTIVKTFTTSSTPLNWTRVSGTFTTNASTGACIIRLGNLTDNSAMTFSGIMLEEAKGVSPTPSPYVPPAITGQITATNTSTYIASLRADVIQIDNTTLDTDGSGNLIIKSNGVDTLQIKNNAVTEISSGFIASTISLSTPSFTTLVTATIVTTASTDKVDILSNFNTTFMSGSNTVVNFRIKRGSTVVFSSYGWAPQYLSPAFSDTPGVGTFVYTLEVAPMAAATVIECSNRYLRLLRISK